MRELDKCCELLIKEECISFPTETVYGLGCDATNCNAVKQIYKLKHRSYSKPLAIFFKSIEEAKKHLIFNEEAEILSAYFMPGEITLVLKKKKNSTLSKFLNINKNTLGFRIPNHEFCLDLLANFENPICVTSANITGQESSTKSEDVKSYFGDSIYIVEKDNKNSSKKPSTIIDLSENEVRFIREGSISFNEIKVILKKDMKR